MRGTGNAKSKVIGDISIFPIGEGTSLGRYVREAYKAMEGTPGARLVPGGMSTVIEADGLATIFSAAARADDALVGMGAQRISINIRIDHRLDKPESIEHKLGRIRGDI